MKWNEHKSGQPEKATTTTIINSDDDDSTTRLSTRETSASVVVSIVVLPSTHELAASLRRRIFFNFRQKSVFYALICCLTESPPFFNLSFGVFCLCFLFTLTFVFVLFRFRYEIVGYQYLIRFIWTFLVSHSVQFCVSFLYPANLDFILSFFFFICSSSKIGFSGLNINVKKERKREEEKKREKERRIILNEKYIFGPPAIEFFVSVIFNECALPEIFRNISSWSIEFAVTEKINQLNCMFCFFQLALLKAFVQLVIEPKKLSPALIQITEKRAKLIKIVSGNCIQFDKIFRLFSIKLQKEHFCCDRYKKCNLICASFPTKRRILKIINVPHQNWMIKQKKCAIKIVCIL